MDKFNVSVTWQSLLAGELIEHYWKRRVRKLPDLVYGQIIQRVGSDRKQQILDLQPFCRLSAQRQKGRGQHGRSRDAAFLEVS